MQGYEKTCRNAFGPYKKTVIIDLSFLQFTENRVIGYEYRWDGISDIKMTTTKNEKDYVKRLVKELEACTYND